MQFLKKFGFTLRKSDPKLLEEIKARLSTIDAKRRALAEEYLPGWGKVSSEAGKPGVCHRIVTLSAES